MACLMPLKRNNVTLRGAGSSTIVFAHGFGCSQEMWRYVAPAFEADHRVVLFDHVGAGHSDLSAYSVEKYGNLAGYAQDVLEIAAALDLRDATFVGHSVSAMIGVLASGLSRETFSRLVLVGPSPRYLNDDGYVGGFDRNEIEELLDFLDSNPLGWSSHMAPVIVGNPDRPEHAEELKNSFCRTDPGIARHFARTTFTADNRADLAKVDVPTLVLQCRDDLIAPEVVGRYVQQNISNSRFVLLDVTGHCPNLTAPEELIREIRKFIAAP
ncbi:MAG: alpha/beta fold hydrolase [Gemmobacter sp.]